MQADETNLRYKRCQLLAFLRLSKRIGLSVFERTVDGNVCITVHHFRVEQLSRVHVEPKTTSNSITEMTFQMFSAKLPIKTLKDLEQVPNRQQLVIQR